jgi:hypothetical protein
MKISSLSALIDLAEDDDLVYSVLTDMSLGRRKASARIYELTEYTVSDDMVRSYRNWANTGKFIPPEKPALRLVEDNIATVLPFQAPEFKKGKAQSSGKRVIAFGDFQINKHDPKFLSKALDLIEDQQPDIICLTGDESDNSAVGRHAQGLREEFESNLQDQIDETVYWLTDIREAAPNAKIHMAHSNHMNWITRAAETRLPGYSTLRALSPEEMYKLDELDIQYERQLIEFLPNYLLGHGHQWNLTSASHKTKGIEHVMRTGCSILAGHVHQATLQTVFIGYEGKGEQKVYANPGCMMDFEKAMESNGGYIGGTSPNWSKGIVVITREAGQNYTELVLGQNDGSFRYEGVVY